ncbi:MULTISPECIES: N-formylglutamate deformylase [Paraburkholderia]|uniref:N-formylglutamate deformylase n=1 Tax=Paraburkholderia podalyriae TaxID=1938811 RepID=A0ABR7PTC2_9BURK|nr:N-formylglutamate deformylase [Paraburkholderia podalyriae]MBC8749518.1 N-formylglutamate deformylase [Paraburkholderia podalyriae]
MTDSRVFDVKPGTLPLVVSIPHLGRIIPGDLVDRYTDAARTVADTDWHLDQLYDFAAQAGASVLSAHVSRYVIDLNRPPSGESLYPGQTTTGLCPSETFRGEPIYVDGKEPSSEEIAARREAFHAPYHAKLRETLSALKAEHGQVLLWEAHSIASVLPRLFDGKLPDLNLGTNSSKSCAPQVLDAATATLNRQPFSWVANGRFKGGYITREYGRPEEGIHAIQLEMCQSTYMNEDAPFDYRSDLAARVKPVVERMMWAALEATRRLSR